MVKSARNIYFVDEYHNLMAQSQHKCKPKVARVTERLFDLKSLPKSLGLINRSKSVSGEPIKFRDGIKLIRVTTFGYCVYKESLSDESDNWKTVNVQTSSTVSHAFSVSETCRRVTGHIKAAKLRTLRSRFLIFRKFYKV